MLEEIDLKEIYDTVPPYVNLEAPYFKYIPPEVPKSISYNPLSLFELVLKAREMYPNQCAIYYVPEERKYTYREMFLEVNRISNMLIERYGVKKDDQVAVMSGNTPELIFLFLAILQCGATLIPINPLLSGGDVVHILKDAGNVKVVFVHVKNYRIVKKASKSVNLKDIVLLATKEPKDDVIPLAILIEGMSKKPPEKVTVDPMNDIATLLYTGGTTGLPKGVMLTHDNIVADVLCTVYMNKTEYEDVLGREVVISVLPLCHSFGFNVLIITIIIGAMIIMEGDFFPNKIMEHIQDYEVRNFTGVPLMFQMIVNHPDFGKYDLNSLETSISGSTTLPSETAKKWMKQVRADLRLTQGYGLTEASPITHMQPHWLPEAKPDSIGIPIMNTGARIVDESYNDVPIGETGELLIKGPQVMKGYWNDSEATRNAFTDNKWLKTGDLARMTEDGYFYIEGRIKDMIKYKAYKVIPKEVEEKLEKHPAISSAAVVGVPDPEIGENIKAFVSLEENYINQITESEIIEWAKENMAAYKYPRYVSIIPSMPRTAVGKVDRKALEKKK